MDNTISLKKDRIIISEPEKYENIEIRNLVFDDGEGLDMTGYNGNVIIGYGNNVKDIFVLSIRRLSQAEQDIICDKIEEMFGQDKILINLMIYDGDNTIYNINDGELTEDN